MSPATAGVQPDGDMPQTSEPPFLLNRSLDEQPHGVASATGSYLHLDNGTDILDACGGAAVAILGHGNQEVISAVVDQMNKVSYVHTGSYGTSSSEDLARCLLQRHDGEFDHGLVKSFFVGSGSEANDAAMKCARQYWYEKGETQRTYYVARRQAYHGNTFGAMSISSVLARKVPYSDVLIPQVSFVGPADVYHGQKPDEARDEFTGRLLSDIEIEFLRLGPENIISFVGETVSGATLGSMAAPPGYWAGVRRLCDKYDILLHLDEVMCGSGRIGTYFAFEQEQVQPDIVTLGKGLGGGYAPIAGMLINDKVVQGLRQGTAAFNHGHTYQAHPVSCAAALAVQKIVRRDRLVERVAVVGVKLGEMLHAAFAECVYVGDVRGRGFFWSVEFVQCRDTKKPFARDVQFGPRVQQMAFKNGVAVYPGAGTVDGILGDHATLAPPYTMSIEELGIAVSALRHAYITMLRRAAAQRLRSPAVAPPVRTSTASIARIVTDNSTSTTRSFPLTQLSFFSTRTALQARFTPPNKPSPPPSQKPAKQQASPVPSSPSSTPVPPTQPTQKPKPSQPEAKPEAEPEEEEVSIPFSDLPDLTQGIPSTLDQELRGATREAAALAAIRDEVAAQAEAGGNGGSGSDGVGAGREGGEDGTGKGGRREKGELPASAYVSSSEKRRQKIANYMFASAFALGVFGTAYAGRDWDEDEAKRHSNIPNGWGVGLWWDRVSARTSELLTYYHEPAFEKLLPDPDPMYGRPYTLCISLEDMLIHSEWTREHGWRIAKRPGADYFIHYLSQYYEIVLFTTIPFAMAEGMVRKLDPYRFISYALFREGTKYKDGEIVKDLSYLNRDLSKVITLDTNPAHVSTHPENAIVLPKWVGDPKNTDLVALIPFLEYIHTMQYGDVRKIIKSFEGKDIPKEFARREAIARAEFQKQLEGQRGKRRTASSGGGLGALLGLKPSSMSTMVSPDGQASLAEQMAQGKMLQDIAREQGQKNYEMMEKEIRENGEKWLTEEAAMQEKMQQEAMQNMKQSFAGWFLSSAESEPKPAESGKQ
ncbi:acetylornithine aminotransferase [Ophiostoma piceae UAMH 11346]|uniref:Mitochondrial import inner membrane translocase subunit TIM50 n=1 Tax=Ophiostoma piceae (strain UAMH 11346) TaxID=1262450 RepID=S3CT31_OPHP1|nr:acetylornithine aminotransferase [Ophiostoma piceae UAMH 11346]